MKSLEYFKILANMTCIIVSFQLFSQLNSNNPSNGYKLEIFQRGLISTGDYETHPTFSPNGDTLYFLKSLPDASFFTICVSYRRRGKWSKPEVADFSGKYNDADPFVAKDGKTIYFVSNRPEKEGQVAKDVWDIWMVERHGASWGKPIHMDSPISSNGNEYFPTIADNGNLYFGSSRGGGRGGADIYVSRWVDGKYLAPENLGDSINDLGNEYEPFIAPDETYLIFMATYPEGIANGDFYISYNKNGIWGKAMKLPPPLNSDATEWGGKVTPDGKMFFFGSNRTKVSLELPARETFDKYLKRLHQLENGLGDIYQMEIGTILRNKSD